MNFLIADTFTSSFDLLSGLVSPRNRPASRRIAVKVINHFGDEVMKVFLV